MSSMNKKIVTVILSLAISFLLLGGLTYAWMYRRAAMSTLLKIQPPDTIAIIPTTDDGSELTMLDLDFHENSSDKNEDGIVTIYRPVCIRSSEPVHRLEIVHTTNLNDLSFNIYLAQKTIDSNNDVLITANKTILSGEYKNETTEGSKLAKQEVLENYGSTSDVADVHAYPLYWIAVNCVTDGVLSDSEITENWQKVTSVQEIGADQKINYNTYYILEISWKETSKETDLFYVMAQNVAH